MEHHIGTAAGVTKSCTIERKPLEDRWSKEAVEAIVGTPWRPLPAPDDTTAPRVLPPLPADQQLRNQLRPREHEVRAPLRPRISKHDLTRWGFTDGCQRCRQMRSGKGEVGTKHSEKCRNRLENEMRRESDPRIKRAEDKHIEFEAERMSAQEAINARRAAEASRRGGANEEDTPPETGTSSSSGAIGHISGEHKACRAALAPISRAALAPIKKKGSTGSPPVFRRRPHDRLYRFCPGTSRRPHDQSCPTRGQEY